MRPTMRVTPWTGRSKRWYWMADLTGEDGDTPLCNMDSGEPSWDARSTALAHAQFVAEKCGFEFVDAEADGG